MNILGGGIVWGRGSFLGDTGVLNKLCNMLFNSQPRYTFPTPTIKICSTMCRKVDARDMSDTKKKKNPCQCYLVG